MLAIQLLGDMQVFRGGESQALPPSKKTRALLAYLAVTGRQHRRDRLCELFWDIPDDPRGALRWSLSKLRNLVDEPQRPRLLADRQSVKLDMTDASVDIMELQRAARQGLDAMDLPDLQGAAERSRGEFLPGLDLPDCHGFHAWCVALREDARRLHRGCLTELVRRLAPEPEAALTYARALLDLDSDDETAWASLIRLLIAAGRRGEAAEQYEAGIRQREQMGMASAALRRAWRESRGAGRQATDAAEAPPRHQEIRFCMAADGTRIAYAEAGKGPPLLRPANWMTHLEYDWQSPIWRHWIQELSRDHRLIRYDERGNGLSDWQVEDLSFAACMSDLEAVVEATGLERFPMLGISQGCAFAVAYAARFPEKVSRLVLYGGYARGWAMRGAAAETERRMALETLIRHGWGADNPAFRQAFTTLFVPDASAEQMRWFNELQRLTVSPENAVRLHHLFGQVQVQAQLAQIRAPTLVLHAREDGVVPFAEGRLIATTIPGARFVPLESRNHILLESEPAWERFVREVRLFFARGAD